MCRARRASSGGSAREPRQCVDGDVAQPGDAEQPRRFLRLVAARNVLAAGMLVRDARIDHDELQRRAEAGSARTRSDRVSRNSASRSPARLDAIWSMMPTGAPTKSVSARWASRARSTSSAADRKRCAGPAGAPPRAPRSMTARCRPARPSGFEGRIRGDVQPRSASTHVTP